MNIFERLRLAFWRGDDLKTQLFAFLASDSLEMRMMGGKRLNRDEARDLLQEIIPASIEVRGVCSLPSAIVLAAPHVSFDHWAEYFCNRAAKKFHTGWVVAKNFRDQDPHSIPIPIGRHIHVNRPTESVSRSRRETETDRARAVHADYVAGLIAASGREQPPLDLLIEFHSHHRTPFLEIATVGLSVDAAMVVHERYELKRGRYRMLPEMLIEPLHELRMTADTTKRLGSLRPEIARCGVHMEIPREARRSDELRRVMCEGVFTVVKSLLSQVPSLPE